ncbi:hypothetical protein [Salipiger bermudensis]|uniref:hypothetical protein n=1 Tax=Salipiger bermudensis TaxID=344736 RepID=UPI001CD2E6A2|nr:hypothetical protein [Salipiger bermudensis]MCA0961546.1 hypothetical protein [Salipiger bermudensis]
MLPTYWGFAAMQMGVEMMSFQMRMARAVYEAGLVQQKALWSVRPAMPMSPVAMGMGICGPVALAGSGRKRAETRVDPTPDAAPVPPAAHDDATPV